MQDLELLVTHRNDVSSSVMAQQAMSFSTLNINDSQYGSKLFICIIIVFCVLITGGNYFAGMDPKTGDSCEGEGC